MRLKQKIICETLRQFSAKDSLTTSAVEIVQAVITLKPGADINKIVEMIYSRPLGACVMYTSDKFRQNPDMAICALGTYLISLCENSKTEELNTTR